jgi:26S proteasome regulatory subunit N1
MYNMKLTMYESLVILGKNHWLLYSIATAMYPRFLITLDENLEPVAATVRVGQV